MKNKDLLALGLIFCFALAGCANNQATVQQTRPAEQVAEEVEPISSYPEDLPEELGDCVTSSVNAFIGGKDIMQYINSGGGVSEFVRSDLIVEAMKQDEKLKPLVISDELSLVGYEKQAKDECLFTFVSEMGSNVSLTYVRVADDEWKIDIDSLLTTGSFRVPSDVVVKINGTSVPSSEYNSGTEIKIEGLLKNVPTTLTYETGLYKDFESTFVLSGSSGTQDARYVLGDDDVGAILPQIESMWRSFQSMVVSGAPENHWGLFYPDTRVTANMIISGWQASSVTPVEELVLQGFELNRSDGIISAYMESKEVISLNLTGSFLKVQGLSDVKTINNWIKIVKEDNQIKLYDCSAEVWLGTGF